KQQVDQAKLEELSLEAQEKLATIEQQSQLLQEKQESLVEARLDQEVAINELQSMITTEKKQKATFEAQKEEAIRKREAQLKAIAAQKAKDEAARIAAAEQLAAQQEAAKTATKKVETQPAVSNPSVADVPNNNTTPTTETVTPPVQESSPVTSSGWGLPVSSISVSSPYGWRANPWGNGPSDFHDGIDLVGASGTSIYASKAGTVATSGYDASAGNYVIINHGDGYYSYYLHLSSFVVSTGQSVGQGSLVGGMGTTGNSTGVHLHFGIATSGSWSGFVDPAPLLGI
ncbi:MAG: peptidoglycan DD-metalloendopeptidase family protein, partial [Enterococcus aquimarinus]|nr:peptidoglycan DD-metalloendopeptidase family protein [Enterococcus aquimarinus]